MMDEIIYGSRYSFSTNSTCCYSSGTTSIASPDNLIRLPPPPAPPPNKFHEICYNELASAYGLSDAASMVVVSTKLGSLDEEENNICSTIRAKIASHPLYPKLLQAYIDCQKVGAPAEIAVILEEIKGQNNKKPIISSNSTINDPELDHFMVTYCEILVKYKSDLLQPFDEATTFLNDMETQLNNIAVSTTLHISDESSEGEDKYSPPVKEDCELKQNLLLKYSGYISSLKHEFSKNKKKGKLPKESKKILLDWWNVHYKWPYPTEGDKILLAETTGLDPKQINNWFINQRKRHWKPSEDMQFAVLDTLCGPFYYE